MIEAKGRNAICILAMTAGLCVFAAYLIPEWLALCKTHLYAYQNGWDEYTYLSWQGALGARNIPGYFSLYLVVWLQQLGVSGAIQNLALDTLLPPLTAYFVYRTLRELNIAPLHAFLYSIIICFASVLFNATDPLFAEYLSKHDSAAWLMGGWENYPSILRTPSPQTSYPLIAAAAFFFLKYRRTWILLVPLPLLYYYVAVPYCILIAGGAIYNIIGATWFRPAVKIIFCSLVAYFCAGLVATVLLRHMGDYSAALHTSDATYLVSRKFQIPIAVAICGGIFALAYRGGILERNAHWIHLMLWILCAMLASGNLQGITGVMISQKNYYDYGIDALGGIAIIVFLCAMKRDLYKILVSALLLGIIAYLTMSSQIFWYDYSLQLAKQGDEIQERVREDPQHAISTDWMVSSFIAYGTARMIAPPLSFQYVYPFVERQCSYNPILEDAALAYAERHLGSQDASFKSLRDMREIARRFSDVAKAQPYRNLEYCQPAQYKPDGFRLLPVAP